MEARQPASFVEDDKVIEIVPSCIALLNVILSHPHGSVLSKAIHTHLSIYYQLNCICVC